MSVSCLIPIAMRVGNSNSRSRPAALAALVATETDREKRWYCTRIRSDFVFGGFVPTCV